MQIKKCCGKIPQVTITTIACKVCGRSLHNRRLENSARTKQRITIGLWNKSLKERKENDDD